MNQSFLYSTRARERSEELLIRNEEKWRNLISSIPYFIALHDLEGRYIFLNHYAEGFSEEDVVGRSLFDFLSEDSKDEYRRHFEACIQTGQIQRFEFSAFGDNRVYRVYETNLIPVIENDRITSVLATAADITDRKQAEAALTDSEGKYRILFENSLVGISIGSPEGKLMQVNSAYARMYGYENPETLLAEVTDVSGFYAIQEERAAVLEILNRVGFMEPRELELVRRDGSRFHAMVSACEIRDAEGKLVFNQAVHIDLTVRKKMEEELRRSKELLENLNQHLEEIRENERTQIALNLHDDLGQKLTALNLEIAWIKGRIGVQSQAVREKLNEMNLMINEAIDSVREVSSFLRPQILFELGIVPAFGWQLNKFEKQSGIKCILTCKPGEFRIDDHISLMLFRILQESLTNVVRHSKASLVEVILRLQKNRIDLSIKDNGTGIEKDKIDSLTSMGIAGMKERLRPVNGSLLIKGTKGSGTVLKISIPLKERVVQ